MEDYNQIIFCNYVWETLNTQDGEVVCEFVGIMARLNKEYLENGGTYPTIEYVLGLAKDIIKMRESEASKEEASKEEASKEEASKEEASEEEASEEEIEESESEKKDRVREARLKFYNN